MPIPLCTVIVQCRCVFAVFDGAYVRLQIIKNMFPATVSKASQAMLRPLLTSNPFYFSRR